MDINNPALEDEMSRLDVSFDDLFDEESAPAESPQSTPDLDVSFDDLFAETSEQPPTAPEQVQESTAETAPKPQPTPATSAPTPAREVVARQPDTFSDMGDEMLESLAPAPKRESKPTYVPVSRDRLYYYDEEGKDRLRREQAAASVMAQELADPAELDAATAQMAQVNAEKQEIYDSVQGDNVSDYGIFGKYITSPEGKSYYVPSPEQNEASMMAFKAAMDTVQGLAGLAGLDDEVARVPTDDPAVKIGAEITSLTLGGAGGVKLASKLKEAQKIGPESNRFAKFLLGPVMSSSAGAAAVATEDTTTISGSVLERDYNLLESKLNVLGESIIFGGVISGAAKTVQGAAKLPGAAQVIQTVSVAFTALTKSSDTLVTDNLASVISKNINAINNPQTEQELLGAYREVYDTLNKTFKDTKGVTFDEFLERSVQQADPGYVPTIGEAIDDTTLQRLERAWRAETGPTGRELTAAAERRREGVLVEARLASDELAPAEETVAGMQKFEETVSPQKAEETATVARLGAEEESAVVQQTERAFAEEEAKAAAKIAEANALDEAANAIERRVQLEAEEVLTGSAVSRSNLDDLQTVIADDVAAERVAGTLSDDLATKSQLGNAKDDAYRGVVIATDDAIDLAEDVLTTLTSKDMLLVTPGEVANVAPLLRRLLYTFRRVDDTPAPIDPTPSPGPAPAPPQTPTPGGAGTLEDLQKQLGEATTPEQFIEISKKISAFLSGRRGRGVSRSEAPEGEIEYPDINAHDLESILLQIRDTSRGLKETAQRTSQRSSFALATKLDEAANQLQSKLDETVSASPAAVEARDNFATFFNGFKERWRSATGREYQADILGASTRADVAEVAEQLYKVFANPRASEAQLVASSNILSAMPADQKTAFAKEMSDRVLYEASKKLNIPALLDGTDTVAKARQAVNALDKTLQGTARYESMLPGALDELREVRNQLASVVESARRASDTAVAGRASAKAIRQQTGQELKASEKALDTAQKASIKAVSTRVTQAQQAIDNSALSNLMEHDNPMRYLKDLLNAKDGATQFRELWTRATLAGPETQMQLRRGVTRALLGKVTTDAKLAQGVETMSIDVLINLTKAPEEVSSQIIRTAYAGDEAGMEFLTRLGNVAASWKKSAFGVRSTGDVSPTKVLQEGQQGVQDILIMLYGPLTKEYRVRAKLIEIGIKMSGGEERLATSLMQHMTDPAKYTAVLERAEQLSRQSMMPPVDAFRNTTLLSVLSSATMKDYFAFNDPVAELERDHKNYVLLEETEEALPTE